MAMNTVYSQSVVWNYCSSYTVYLTVCWSLGCRGPVVLDCTMQGSPRAEPVHRPGCQGPPLVPSLPRPPRPATSANPTEETAPTAVAAASSASIPSFEATTPSPEASPPALEPEKPPAPESSGTEELPEDGEPDAAELRRRRLQKLESPVAH